MKYSIRKSNVSDLPKLLELASQARIIMRKSGNFKQWDEDYPSYEIFSNDISNGNSYIIEDENNIAIATFAFIHSPEPTYSIIEKGEWLDDKKDYYVLHRIASTPNCHGIFNMILDFAFNVTDNIRIDTHKDNKIMQHLITKNAFTYCGIIYLANGDERLAYQKILTL